MARTKRVDAALRDHFGDRLRRWVDERHGGNQSAAARELGVTQGHISATISGQRGVGLNFLLIFAAATDSSLDELLGMAKTGSDDDRIRRLLREELTSIRADIRRDAVDTSTSGRSKVRRQR